MTTIAELRDRADAILAFMEKRRNHPRIIEVARAVGLPPWTAAKTLKRLEDAGIVEGIDEPGMTVRWRIADRVLCCPDCREPMGDHRLDRARGKGYVWRCPHEPVKCKGRNRR